VQHLLCYLWLVLLAAAIPCLIAWHMWPRETLAPPRREGDDDEIDTEDMPSILWLTPACAAALGDCADPAVLSEMSEAKIGRMLERAHRPPGEKLPTAEHYRTWPEQAAMLAAGKYDALRDWQGPWLHRAEEDQGDATEVDGELDGSRGRTWAEREMWFWAALLLLTAALLSAIAAPWLGWCSERGGEVVTYPPTSPPPPPTTEKPRTRLELSTDAFFDYKRSDTYHPAVLRSRLRSLFSRFEGIEVVSVSGHTDPIGSTADNQALGAARATTIVGAIRDVAKTARTGQFADSHIPTRDAGDGASGEDAEVWRYCYGTFQVSIADPRFRPLRELDRARNPDRRPACTGQSTAGVTRSGYPACAGPYDKVIPAGLKVYARQAENFREITSCLSPMRHVVVNITYDRQVSPQS
jgi:hypothetical protein